jgi:hypothetical protein
VVASCAEASRATWTGGGLQRSGVLAACVAVASSRAAVLGVVMYTVARKGGRGGMQVGRRRSGGGRGEGAEAFMSGDAEKMRQRASKAAAHGGGGGVRGTAAAERASAGVGGGEGRGGEASVGGRRVRGTVAA